MRKFIGKRCGEGWKDRFEKERWKLRLGSGVNEREDLKTSGRVWSRKFEGEDLKSKILCRRFAVNNVKENIWRRRFEGKRFEGEDLKEKDWAKKIWRKRFVVEDFKVKIWSRRSEEKADIRWEEKILEEEISA